MPKPYGKSSDPIVFWISKESAFRSISNSNRFSIVAQRTGTQSKSAHYTIGNREKLFSQTMLNLSVVQTICVWLKPNLIQCNTKLITKSSPSSEHHQFSILIEKGSNNKVFSLLSLSAAHSHSHSIYFHYHFVYFCYPIPILGMRSTESIMFIVHKKSSSDEREIASSV